MNKLLVRLIQCVARNLMYYRFYYLGSYLYEKSFEICKHKFEPMPGGPFKGADFCPKCDCVFVTKDQLSKSKK